MILNEIAKFSKNPLQDEGGSKYNLKIEGYRIHQLDSISDSVRVYHIFYSAFEGALYTLQSKISKHF